MDLVSVLGIAIGLAMDAFAVSVATGLALGRATGRQTFRIGFHFGLFQFLMPIVGWIAGLTVERWLGAFDHWIAFALLSWVGVGMIRSGIRNDGEPKATDPSRGLTLVVLSVATSLDALAVGVSMALLGVDVWFPAVIIGLVAGALSAAGMHLGRPLGRRAGRRLEIAGGLVLIGIGVKIVLEHLL